MKISQELEENIDRICIKCDITKEDIKKSQSKYINNRNCYKVIGQKEVLETKVPRWLTQAEARQIKMEMEEFAF